MHRRSEDHIDGVIVPILGLGTRATTKGADGDETDAGHDQATTEQDFRAGAVALTFAKSGRFLGEIEGSLNALQRSGHPRARPYSPSVTSIKSRVIGCPLPSIEGRT
ncbi:MAG: hypothetical protein EBV06_15090 [Planctomycetia bacterium]|nr:hypothetical protein [Planctomycetia bacterium]